MSGYNAKMIMHLKFAEGGFSFKYELVDYPGVFVYKTRESSSEPIKQEIVYANISYGKFAEAIEMWERDHSAPAEGK